MITAAVAALITGLWSFQPASASGPTSGPATRPAEPVARYHALLKLEFMRDGDGRIVRTDDRVRDAVARVRQAAADEKADLDEQIQQATADVRGAVQAKRAAKDSERDLRSRARREDARSTDVRWRVRNGRIEVNRRRDSAAAASADHYRDQARQQSSAADQADGDVRSAHADLVAFKRRLAVLAAIASPASRVLPPKEFWACLSADDQAALSRVGITLAEFKAFLPTVGLTEQSIVATGKALEESGAGSDRLSAGLLAEIDRAIRDSRPSLSSAATRPASNVPGVVSPVRQRR